jgi:hypothetical protein
VRRGKAAAQPGLEMRCESPRVTFAKVQRRCNDLVDVICLGNIKQDLPGDTEGRMQEEGKSPDFHAT